MGEELEIRAVEERPYWETCTYTESNNIILGNLQTGQRAAIAIGYYLKHIRENKLYLDGGYQSFGEYVRAECGMSESTASRNIGRMEQFSEGGNSPKLADQWRDYGASQLQEIMYLTDEQREQVTPGMTVKEIREIRKPEPVPEVESDPVEETPVEVLICEEVELESEIVYEAIVEGEGPAETVIVESSVEEMLPDVEEGACGPAKCITGQSDSGFCGGAAYCSEPYTCCAQCNNDCNGRCGWLGKPEKVETVVEEVATSQVPAVELITEDCPWAGELDECAVLSNECCNPDDTCLCCKDCTEPLCEIRCKYAKVSDSVEVYDDDPGKEVAEKVTKRGDHKIDFEALDRMVEAHGHGEAWFVEKWAEMFPKSCKEVVDIIHRTPNGEKAKAVQKYLAPCGFSSSSSKDHDCTFRSFTGGIDLRFGNKKMHLKYGHFVKELEELWQEEVIMPQAVTEDHSGKQQQPISVSKNSKVISEMSGAARNSLSNAQVAINAKAWKAALVDARHLVHYLEVIVREMELEDKEQKGVKV